jgi:DNA-binding NtrC family response regulator
LQRHGYRVFEAESGLKALPIWNERPAEFDLLLTDMVMPDGLSGRDLAKKLLAEKNNLKVIYATGYSLEVLNPDFPLEDGVNFLTKPYSLEKLVHTVRRCLDT